MNGDMFFPDIAPDPEMECTITTVPYGTMVGPIEIQGPVTLVHNVGDAMAVKCFIPEHCDTLQKALKDLTGSKVIACVNIFQDCQNFLLRSLTDLSTGKIKGPISVVNWHQARQVLESVSPAFLAETARLFLADAKMKITPGLRVILEGLGDECDDDGHQIGVTMSREELNKFVTIALYNGCKFQYGSTTIQSY